MDDTQVREARLPSRASATMLVEGKDCLPSWKAAQELANWHRMHGKKSPVKVSQTFRRLVNESKEHSAQKCDDNVKVISAEDVKDVPDVGCEDAANAADAKNDENLLNGEHEEHSRDDGYSSGEAELDEAAESHYVRNDIKLPQVPTCGRKKFHSKPFWGLRDFPYSSKVFPTPETKVKQPWVPRDLDTGEEKK